MIGSSPTHEKPKQTADELFPELTKKASRLGSAPPSVSPKSAGISSLPPPPSRMPRSVPPPPSARPRSIARPGSQPIVVDATPVDDDVETLDAREVADDEVETLDAREVADDDSSDDADEVHAAELIEDSELDEEHTPAKGSALDMLGKDLSKKSTDPIVPTDDQELDDAPTVARPSPLSTKTPSLPASRRAHRSLPSAGAAEPRIFAPALGAPSPQPQSRGAFGPRAFARF